MKATSQRIFTAQQIPSFSNKTIEGAKQWWDEMLELGLYITPDDAAENHIDVDTGERILDDGASAKVNSIYDEMFKVLGEETTYDTGTTAWWKHRGYRWDEQRQEWINVKDSPVTA